MLSPNDDARLCWSIFAVAVSIYCLKLLQWHELYQFRVLHISLNIIVVAIVDNLRVRCRYAHSHEEFLRELFLVAAMKVFSFPLGRNSATNSEFWSPRWNSVAEKRSMERRFGLSSRKFVLRHAVDFVLNNFNKFVEAINVLISVLLMKKFEDDGFVGSDVSLGNGWFCFTVRGINF